MLGKSVPTSLLGVDAQILGGFLPALVRALRASRLNLGPSLESPGLATFSKGQQDPGRASIFGQSHLSKVC